MAMAPGSEHRGAERISFTDHLRVKKPTTQHATGADISSTGISIVVPNTIPEGTAVELELFNGTMFATGKVVKVASSVRGFRVGIQFAKPEPALFTKAKGIRP